MPSEAGHSVSKWKKINVTVSDPTDTFSVLPINDMKYCPTQLYGVTFNEYEYSIKCRILDVCEGTLSPYELRTVSTSTTMDNQLFNMKLVDYYWVTESYLVLLLFSSELQSIHHIGFTVDYEMKALLSSEDERSISRLTFSDDAKLSNEEVDNAMPWLAGICPLFIKGEAYMIVSTVENLIINKFRPHRSFEGRQIENLCDAVKGKYMCGAIPFSYGSKLYFVIHQSAEYLNRAGEDRRKLYTDRIFSVNLSNLDVSSADLFISDETVQFEYIPLKKLNKGDFFSTRRHDIRQQGQYLIVNEKKFLRRSKYRPASKRAVFVIDLSAKTTMLQNIEMRSNSYASLVKEYFLIFDNDACGLSPSLEYKFESLVSNNIPRLRCIILKKLLMNRGIPMSFRHIFF